ncbi:MAG: electron transfer flavoprotein subunit alpha/FixB family protein, partial [Acidimicrobiia bacterium]
MVSVWVFIEEVDAGPSVLGLELLAKARSLGDVTAVYLGTGSDEAFAALGEHGASSVLHADAGDRLPSGPLAAALADRVAVESPELFLFGQAYTDRDVAGRLGVRLGVGVLSNASDVRLTDAGVETDHEIFGGSQVATASSSSGPFLVLIRPKSFPAEPVGGDAPSVVTLELPDVGYSEATVVESHVEEHEGPQLGEAAIVVSG